MHQSKHSKYIVIYTTVLFVLISIYGCSQKKFALSPKYDYTFNGTLKVFDTVYFHTNVKSGATFYWNFGDSTFSTDSAPKHVFQYSKTATVTLCIDNDTLQKISHVLDILHPSYDFSYTGTLFVNDTVYFHSNVPEGSTFYWSFGDGAFSTESAPKHVYSKYKYTNGYFPWEVVLIPDTVVLIIIGDVTHPIFHFVQIKPNTGIGC